ncbi:hypothetical protein GY45DRAFT_1438458 [Cubamyces sp. BRFM 1775]|nr:hypothetical protein GY45DRAFT_1438458 [Cubamyces sp. BRFM 1775]
MYFYDNDAGRAIEPISLLEELLDEGSSELPPPSRFHQDTDGLVQVSSSNNIGSPPLFTEFDPCTWNDIDWMDVFTYQAWASSSSPPSLFSGDEPPPPSPASDATLADSIGPLSDWVSVPGDDSFHTATSGSPSPFEENQQFTLDIDVYAPTDRPRLESPPPLVKPPAGQTQQRALVETSKVEDVKEDTPPPAKCRRRQDTTPRFECQLCNSRFARSHNLKVHIKSVHENQRSFPCKVPGCTHAFSRKHDLTRHFQSKHTTMGSPRRKGNKA